MTEISGEKNPFKGIMVRKEGIRHECVGLSDDEAIQLFKDVYIGQNIAELEKFKHLVPLWYVLMCMFGCTFRQAMLAIRQGEVRTSGSVLQRDNKKNKIEVLSYQGAVTFPDSIIYVTWENKATETQVGITSWLLSMNSKPQGDNKEGILTTAQIDGMPEELQKLIPRGMAPKLLLCEVAKLSLSDLV